MTIENTNLISNKNLENQKKYEARRDIISKIQFLQKEIPKIFSFFSDGLPFISQYLNNNFKTKIDENSFDVTLISQEEIDLIKNLYIFYYVTNYDKTLNSPVQDIPDLILIEPTYQKEVLEIINEVKQKTNQDIDIALLANLKSDDSKLSKEQIDKLVNLSSNIKQYKEKDQILKYLFDFSKEEYKMLVPQSFSLNSQRWQLVLDKYNQIKKLENINQAYEYILINQQDKLLNFIVKSLNKNTTDQNAIEMLRQLKDRNSDISTKLIFKQFNEISEEEINELFGLANEIKRENNEEEIVRFKDVTLNDLEINVLNPTETPTNSEVIASTSDPETSVNEQQQNTSSNSATAPSNPVKTVVKTGNKLFSFNNIINPILNALASSRVIISKLADNGFGYAFSGIVRCTLDDNVVGSAVSASKILTTSRVMTFVPALVIELANMAYTKFYKKEEFSIKDSMARFFSAGISTLLAAFTLSGITISGFATAGLGVLAYVGLAFAFNTGMQAGYNKFVNNDITPDNNATHRDALASQNQQLNQQQRS